MGPPIPYSTEPAPRGFVFTRALRATLRRPGVWVFAWFVVSFLSLVPAYAVFGYFQDEMGHRYQPGALVHTLDHTLLTPDSDTSFRSDHAVQSDVLQESIALIGALVAFLMLLWSVFAAGGWLQIVLERKRGHSLRRFLFGGARYFWRFLRLMLLCFLLLALFGWILYEEPWQELVLRRELGLPSFDLDSLENLDSERTAVNLSWLQGGLYGLCFALTLTWADYTRTRLALHDTTSVFGAGLRTFFTMLRHPIMTLRPMLLLLLVELLVLALGALLRGWFEGGMEAQPSWIDLALVVLAGQLVVIWRIVTRGARYQAAAAVSTQVVRPLSRPDPWKSSIGGPGGPRYPLEDADEYGVSL